MKDETKVYSFRLSKQQVEAINQLGLNLHSLIKKYVNKVSKEEKCPTCNQTVSKKHSS